MTMKNFIFTLCALLPLSGCVGSYINSASEIVDIEGVPAAEGMIVLGERLEDPYAVENPRIGFAGTDMSQRLVEKFNGHGHLFFGRVEICFYVVHNK